MDKVATVVSLGLVLVIVACGPAQLLESGRPEEAFERAAKRLERDPSGGRRLVDVLTRACERSQGDRYGERRADLWAATLGRRGRMEVLRLRLLRVVSLSGWDAEPDYADGLAAASREATPRLPAAAQRQAEGARYGDRFAARASHDLLHST